MSRTHSGLRRRPSTWGLFASWRRGLCRGSNPPQRGAECTRMSLGRLQSRSVHRLVGSIVALLMLFLSMGALTSSPHRQFAHAEQAPGVAAAPLLDAYCLGSGETPSRDRRDCSDRCVLCGVRDCDTLTIHAVTGTIDACFGASGATDRIARRVIVDEDGGPLGWASSWSSRAPPSFS